MSSISLLRPKAQITINFKVALWARRRKMLAQLNNQQSFFWGVKLPFDFSLTAVERTIAWDATANLEDLFGNVSALELFLVYWCQVSCTGLGWTAAANPSWRSCTPSSDPRQSRFGWIGFQYSTINLQSLKSLTWQKAMMSSLLWPKARPKAALWPKAGPKAILCPKAEPKAMLWPKAMLFLLIVSMMASFTPSQNILQSLQKWKDILEYITINLELLKLPTWKKFGANCAPLKDNALINLNVLFEFQLAAPKPMSADKLEEFAECKPRPAGKLIVLAERKPRTPRPAGKLYWELSVAAIGCSTKDSSSDFLPWHSPRWELSVAAIGCPAKDSCSVFLSWHSPCVWVFCISIILLGSSASCFWDKLYFSFWWKVTRKLCIQIHSFGWFASWLATWFIRWIVYWFFKLKPMLFLNLISSNRAHACECICMTCWKKDERLQSAQRALKELSLQFNLLLFNASIIF